MGWIKKILLAFVVLAIIGAIFGDDTKNSALSTSQAQESANTNTNVVNLITKTPAEMLPTRAEIPTEFTTDPVKDVTLNASGFESGKELSTTKLEGSSGLISVDYTIYKFSTADSAKSWYDKRVNEIKENGGYKEISIAGCFAWKADFGIDGEDGQSICLKNNIVYIVGGNAAQTLKQIDSFMKDGTSVLNKKIV